MLSQEAKKRNRDEAQYRYLELIEMRAVDGEEGVYEFSFSSETPVPRWWGTEVLGHDPGEPKLERLKTVGSFLFAHGRDPNYGVVPLGPIVDAWQDKNARTCRVKVRFDGDEDAQVIKGKVDSKSLKGVSMRYITNAYTVVEPGKTVRGFTGPCEIATDWEPLEVSLEPIAADPSVGVGRSEAELIVYPSREDASSASEERVPPDPPESNARNEPSVTDSEPPAVEPNNNSENNNRSDVNMTPEEIRAMEKAAEQRATERAAGINALCGNFPNLNLSATDYIRSEMTIEQINIDVLHKLADSQRNTHVHTPAVDFVTDESDKFRAAAEDALLMRCGITTDKPSAGANELRGYSMYELASEALERRGEKVRGKDKREVAEKALLGAGERVISIRSQGTSDFPSILANVANKVMRKAYEEVATTYQEWVQFADATDFKEMSRPQFSESPDLDVITEGGNYKTAEFSDTTEKYKVLTYGKKFVVSRQTIINDDLNVISRLPKLFGAAAARKVNALVYAILIGNPKMADNVDLFHATHKNLAGTAAAVSVDSLGKARADMRKQKAIAGKATLNIMPRFLIIPAQIEVPVMQVIKSAYDPSKSNSMTYNPFTSLMPIVEPLLDDSSLTSWYLAADPSQIDTIEVAFLNGQRAPYQEQRIGFDVDGLEMKVRIDVGAKALDFRGLYKNTGA
ncbi:hypothetical protein M7775_13665 [Sporomusa sphaeroides DSM 2875]|uniref:prohead protease/major capsid protein fusion protein n=1 Tax=Sporomusa sphaeroides TaxID=47679 RepID=UPI00202DBA25|nr:prohead protease/major capsid protein fusion protein [Sporomusa sphaeroides]MCM0759601.1 hypothetical protein [Sporomusa sphaeroides DSM 2875]